MAGRAVAGGWRLVGRSVARDVGEGVEVDDLMRDEDDSVHSALRGHNAASWSKESRPDSCRIGMSEYGDGLSNARGTHRVITVKTCAGPFGRSWVCAV